MKYELKKFPHSKSFQCILIEIWNIRRFKKDLNIFCLVIMEWNKSRPIKSHTWCSFPHFISLMVLEIEFPFLHTIGNYIGERQKRKCVVEYFKITLTLNLKSDSLFFMSQERHISINIKQCSNKATMIFNAGMRFYCVLGSLIHCRI